MRADLTFTALADESNRYQLAKSVAKVTRILHRPNTRVQDTMNEAFKGARLLQTRSGRSQHYTEKLFSPPSAPPHDPAFDQIPPSPWRSSECQYGKLICTCIS
jgi:hypothetical protein